MRTHRSLAQRGAAVIAAGLLGLGVTACGDMMDEFDQPPVDDMDPGVDDPGVDDGFDDDGFDEDLDDDGFDDNTEPTEDPLDE
jgi:hypothetical protein